MLQWRCRGHEQTPVPTRWLAAGRQIATVRPVAVVGLPQDGDPFTRGAYSDRPTRRSAGSCRRTADPTPSWTLSCGDRPDLGVERQRTDWSGFRMVGNCRSTASSQVTQALLPTCRSPSQTAGRLPDRDWHRGRRRDQVMLRDRNQRSALEMKVGMARSRGSAAKRSLRTAGSSKLASSSASTNS